MPGNPYSGVQRGVADKQLRRVNEAAATGEKKMVIPSHNPRPQTGDSGKAAESPEHSAISGQTGDFREVLIQTRVCHPADVVKGDIWRDLHIPHFHGG